MVVANRNIRADDYLRAFASILGGISIALGCSVIIGWYGNHATFTLPIVKNVQHRPNGEGREFQSAALRP